MRERPTLRSVALKANVSIATVSKVVNGIAAGVSEATRKEVEAAIEELGYRPNRVGRSLRSQRHQAVGLAIVDPSPRFLADPFTTNLVAGLCNQLNTNGFGLLLYGVMPGKLSESSLIRQSEVDAICLNPSGTRDEREAAMELVSGLGQPLVVFQDRPVQNLQDVCFVRQDDAGGAELLANEVMKRPRRRAVMVIADIPWPAVENRVAGFRKVFEARGVQLDLVTCDETDSQAISSGIAGYLDDHGVPDVIVGQNDQIAIACIDILTARGLEVPRDVAVTGYNAFPFTGLSRPALATVRSRAYDVGVTAASAILERLENGRFRQREYVLPLELVPGNSAP
ncbi:LacI family DNA-binding transcriptional regulator [Mesorhizobium marinum]|uniref:LacI family DNA-binding transcriptional regulator n=1 Tax=Mesorhizobium marinum TaxID=3228790 RepID=A0ABV3R2G4_9HYPH